jgi:hypothetical protein
MGDRIAGSIRSARGIGVVAVCSCLAAVQGFWGASGGLGQENRRADSRPAAEAVQWKPVQGTSAAAVASDPERLERLRSRAQSGDDPEAWLAFGAALLCSDDWRDAAIWFRKAQQSPDARIREDATYDLALAWAVAGSPDSGAAGAEPVSGGQRGQDVGELDDPGSPRERLLRARDGFRAVLRGDPRAEDARWNLELVERWLDEEESGADPDDTVGAGQPAGGEGADDGSGGGPMTPEEAQRLLEAAAGQEREVQARRLERNRDRDPQVERNW